MFLVVTYSNILQESNLRVPQADPTDGVKKKHGAAFGRGIYTCPDYKMAKEEIHLISFDGFSKFWNL